MWQEKQTNVKKIEGRVSKITKDTGYPDEVILGGFAYFNFLAIQVSNSDNLAEKLSICDVTDFLQTRQNTNDPNISDK